MRMRSKTLSGRDDVVIDDAQTAITHPLRIIIICETESVIAIQPAMFSMPSFVCLSYLHAKTMARIMSLRKSVSALAIDLGRGMYAEKPENNSGFFTHVLLRTLLD